VSPSTGNDDSDYYDDDDASYDLRLKRASSRLELVVPEFVARCTGVGVCFYDHARRYYV